MQTPMIEVFAQSCEAATLKPTEVLKAAGIHPSLWWKWKSGGVSPTLRNFEAALIKLEEMGGQPCGCGGRKARKAKRGA